MKDVVMVSASDTGGEKLSYNPFYNIENSELLGYEYAWVNYIKNNVIPEGIIPKEILESWSRCRALGLGALAGSIDPHMISDEELAGRTEENSDFLNAARHVTQEMLSMLSEESVQMWIADKDRVILLDFGKQDTKVDKDVKGTSNAEEHIGTNSIDLCISLGKPVSVVGAQHYCQEYHKRAYYAAPIRRRKNEIIGAIGLGVLCEEMNNYMLAMIAVAARTIENEITLLKNNAIIFQHNKEKQSILDSVTDGVIHVDKEQIITQANLQMMEMTGLEKEELIGQHISVVETLPTINSIEKNIEYAEKDLRVKVKSKTGYFSCFLNRNIINEDNPESKSIIWIFTEINEIQELADKISLANRAFFTFENIIGDTRDIKQTIALAKKVAAYEARVILEGESGTGKEILAQSIHNDGQRKNGPFVAVDCGAIPRELLESEMFGYEEGAYTGARKGGARGKFELANKGTLFLDEVSNLPLEMQAKLLRTLQENKIVRIGGDRPIPIDAHIMAATNKDLKEEVANGTFREDLFYRLDIVHIKVPALRERKADIPLIVNNYIKINSARLHKKVKGLDEEAMRTLMAFNWPGNVRQLNNVIERMMILTDKEIMTKDAIPPEIKSPSSETFYEAIRSDDIDSLDMVNRKYIKRVVEQFGGNIKKASERLGISRATVYRYLEK